VIVTPTASGKTLCYNLPVLDRLTAEPGARATYLFPTKALAEDQLDELHGLIEDMGQISARSLTMEILRRMRGALSGSAQISCSLTRTCCKRESCRTILSGSGCLKICGTSWWMSCIITAASMAVIWRTSAA
jgi:hypothetical protein